MSIVTPVIKTERLVLRAPRMQDYDGLCAYFAEDRSAFNGGPLGPLEVWRLLMNCAGQWQIRGHGLWHISLGDNDEFVGFAGIFHPIDWPEPELGYGVMSEYEGMGIAFEAAMAARDAATAHLGLIRLPSYIAPDNTRSQALAQRMGAVREADITLRGEVSRVYRHPQTDGQK